MRLREDHIHYAIRQRLRASEWTLIAGQYPNGSDDELPPLNVVDPALARDNSPDPRRHSQGKLVPDLVACKGDKMLLIEMKPCYCASDETKLDTILGPRRADFLKALRELIARKGIRLAVPLNELVFIPCLGMSAGAARPERDDFCYFDVSGPDADSVAFHGNSLVPVLAP